MFVRPVKTICPVCNKNREGTLHEEEGKIFLRKVCAEHGEFKDLISSDATLFSEKISFFDHFKDHGCSIQKCKQGIFHCATHQNRKSPITFIEITSRCNMQCPVCYADADFKGKDVPYEDVVRMLAVIAREDSLTHLVLIGGEPTIHSRFFDILAKAKEYGLMERLFIATNGLTMADKAFCEKVYAAGVHNYYLGFDGTDKEACIKIRGNLKTYDGVRKTIEHLRACGKVWCIASFTACKDVNLHVLKDTLLFCMDNQDVVKRLMIAPEVFNGRVYTSNLMQKRITGDCVERLVCDQLGIQRATVPYTLFYRFLEPLKIAGLLDMHKWVTSNFSPLCGHMGLIGMQRGNYYSMIDRLIAHPRKNIARAGRFFVWLADQMTGGKRVLQKTCMGRLIWGVLVYGYFLPLYGMGIFFFVNKYFLLNVIGACVQGRFNAKKMKRLLLGEKRVELYYLLGCDKYNFIWDRIPYCANHHYRIHPSTGEVIKVPGCLVFPWREQIE